MDVKNGIGWLAAGAWITASEFIRNELLFKSLWVGHYANLKLTFETTPLNGFLWLVWSLIAAAALYQLQSCFSFRRTVLIGWAVLFPTMWITLFNLQVLPLGLLIYAVPLSFVEVAVAVWIMRWLAAPARP